MKTMAGDSVPIFSKVEATLSTAWLKIDGSDITELLGRIERATDKKIEIRFQNGRYVICGSLVHINVVHDLLSAKDVYPHLQLEFNDESLLNPSGPPSFIYPNRNHEVFCVPQESDIEESEMEFVTTYTDGKERRNSGSWQSENVASDVSERSEAMRTSASTENSNVGMCDKSADISGNMVAGHFDFRKEEVSEVTEKGASMNYTTTSDDDKHDSSCSVEANDKTADTSDKFACGTDEKDRWGDDGEETIDTDNCVIGEDNCKAALEANNLQGSEISSDERMVDPEIWDYMQAIKSNQLQDMLEPLGASYRCEWDSTDGVYRVRLVIQSSTNENSQKSLALVCERFDRLYTDLFSSCEIEPIAAKYLSGGTSVEDVRIKFPGVFLKRTDENALLIGPRDDVQKAKKFLVSKSKKAGRMSQSFSASSSRSCVDLSQHRKASEDRICQSAIFTAGDSLTSAEDADSLKGTAEEAAKWKSPTTDEAQSKDEKMSNKIWSAENESAGTDHDGCGDGSTIAEFEQLDDNNDQREKSSSSDSFSILQSSPTSSFDDAEVELK